EYFWRVRASSSIGEGEWSDTTSFTTIIEKSEVTQLLSPVNDTTDVSITPTLTWSSAERAEDYQVQASTDSTFETILYDVSEIDSLNYQMETLDFNTVYYWRLKASNVGGESDWSENWSFFTEYALDKPVAETPINEAIDVEIPARFEWKPIDGADDYLLQLSKDENFESEIGLSEHTDAELQTTQNRLAKSISEKSWNISQTVEGLDFSTKYFWRVKAINNEGHSSWSQTQFFTTQDAPIEGIVNLTSPSHNSEDVDFPVELTWDEFTEAKYYNLELSESPAFDATISVRDLEATSFETSQLSDTTTYYWRVRASVDEQLTAWSAIWSFKTVLGIPEVPTWTPENEAEDVSQTPFISWGSSKRATTFDFQISKADDFSEIIFEAENLESTNIKIENKLESRTKYYWHVRANNQSGSSNWSETLSFITVLEKPDSVQLLIPQKDEWYPIDNPYFEWTSSEQADEYVFHLSKEEDFESFVLDTIITAPDTSFTMDEYLEADVFYYWRVKAANESGESEWSEVFDFLGNGGLSTETETLPTEFTLQQNYPNPFNPTTQIRYGIPNAAEVRLEVFNMLGQKVSTLVKERKSAGWHNATFDASELSSGFYIYRIQAGEFISTKKLLLIK
ncbi:MAG: T9SS type A sorting domain-containing protein, partial [Balneolaceae bacterium]